MENIEAMTTDTDPTGRLASMQATLADFSTRWRQWAFANMPIVKHCEAHRYDRRVNEERSIGESWRRQEFVILYRKCPCCIREKMQNKPNNHATKN